MWIALAVLAFLAGQVYLFRCLGKMDSFLERQPGEENADKEVLSIALEDPALADPLGEQLEGFSVCYPDVDIMLVTCADVAGAVYEGSATVGFLPADRRGFPGLNCRTLCCENLPRQEIIWKKATYCAAAYAFAEYLCAHGVSDGRKAR